jgi:hypothetical protein
MATKFGIRRFNDKNEVHEAVVQYLMSKPAQFYRDANDIICTPDIKE